RIAAGFDRHAIGPRLGVVRIFNHDGERAPQGETMSHTGEDARHLRLDLHAAAAAIAQLPPLQVARDVLRQQPYAGRQSIKDPDERGPVGLSGGQKTKSRHASAASRSAGARSLKSRRSSQISSDAIACWT